MKHKALFLDRDGIINLERGEYTWRRDDFKFVSDIFETLKLAIQKSYSLIIISNQGGIAKNLYSKDDLDSLTAWMINEFDKEGIKILEFLYCPHHPEFNGRCICRKPDSLLFEKALAKHQIDPQLSFMIGDKERDILSAEKCRIKSFLIPANESIKNIVSLIP